MEKAIQAARDLEKVMEELQASSSQTEQLEAVAIASARERLSTALLICQADLAGTWSADTVVAVARLIAESRAAPAVD